MRKETERMIWYSLWYDFCTIGTRKHRVIVMSITEPEPSRSFYFDTQKEIIPEHVNLHVEGGAG